MGEEENFESSFNISAAIMMELQNLRNQANYHFIKKNIEKAFRILKAMKMTISCILQKEEIDEIEELENKLEKYILNFNAVHPYKRRGKEFSILSFRISKTFQEYNDRLMNALQEHDLNLKSKDKKRIRF